MIYGDKKHRTREQKIKTTEDHHQATFRPQALSGQGGEGDADHNGQVLIFTIFSIFRLCFLPMAMVAAALLVLLMASGSLALQLPGVLVIQGVHVLLEDVVVAKGAMAEVLEKVSLRGIFELGF